LDLRVFEDENGTIQHSQSSYLEMEVAEQVKTEFLSQLSPNIILMSLHFGYSVIHLSEVLLRNN
jgi:hypothetical protein